MARVRGLRGLRRVGDPRVFVDASEGGLEQGCGMLSLSRGVNMYLFWKALHTCIPMCYRFLRKAYVAHVVCSLKNLLSEFSP